MNKKLLIGLFVYSVIGLFLPHVDAATMQNNNYSIEKRTIDIKPYQSQSQQPKDTTQKPLVEGFNYTIDSTMPEAFSFSLSPTMIDFGELTATNPIIRKLTLTIDSDYPYQIQHGANHPLQTADNQIIPDTTCDNGSCSDITGALWTNTLTYGFGYRLDAMDSGYFKQIPDVSRNEIPVPVIEATSAQKQTIPLTYKVTISGAQEKGDYKNSILFLATPNY